MIFFIFGIPVLMFLIILCFYSCDEPAFPTDDIRRPKFDCSISFSADVENVLSRFISYENYVSFLRRTEPKDNGQLNYAFCFILYLLYSYLTSPFSSVFLTLAVALAISAATYFICSFLYRRFFSFPHYDLSSNFLMQFASSGNVSTYFPWYDAPSYQALLTSAGCLDYDPMSLYIIDCRVSYCSQILESIIFRRKLRKFLSAFIAVLFFVIAPLFF